MRLPSLCDMLIGLLTAFPASAQDLAQDIAQQMDQIGAGSYLVFDAGERGFVQVFRGPSGATWVVDLVEGRDPNGPRLSREYRDARGQLVRVDFAGGLSLQFNPHNCQRTIGACLFIQTGPDGESQQGRLTTATADGFRFEMSIFPSARAEPVLADKGEITLDAMGSMVGGQMTAQDGSVTGIRLVQAVYR